MGTLKGVWANVIICQSSNKRIDCQSSNQRIDCKANPEPEKTDAQDARYSVRRAGAV